jgi:hypothetical protein
MVTVETIEGRVQEYMAEHGPFSEEFRLGFEDVVRSRLEKVDIPNRYERGSVHFDAYYLGKEHGYVEAGRWMREKLHTLDGTPEYPGKR